MTAGGQCCQGCPESVSLGTRLRMTEIRGSDPGGGGRKPVHSQILQARSQASRREGAEETPGDWGRRNEGTWRLTHVDVRGVRVKTFKGENWEPGCLAWPLWARKLKTGPLLLLYPFPPPSTPTLNSTLHLEVSTCITKQTSVSGPRMGSDGELVRSQSSQWMRRWLSVAKGSVQPASAARLGLETELWTTASPRGLHKSGARSHWPRLPSTNSQGTSP